MRLRLRRLLPLAFAGLLAGPLAAAPATFVEASVTPPHPVVAQQLVYRLRFFHRVAVADLRFAAPAARLAEVRPLESALPAATEREIDGERYRVHERHYAVFPFASGRLALEGGGVQGRTAAGQAFDLPAAVPPLDVQAAPQLPPGAAWLPAKRLVLQEEVAGAEKSLRPGDVVRRRVRIEAVGIDAGTLPELHLLGDGFRVVAASATLDNRAAGYDNRAVREQLVELQPTRGGELVLPALAVAWWNTERNTWEETRLPARRIEAQGFAEATDATEAAEAAEAAVALPPVAPATPIGRPPPAFASLPLAAALAALAVLLLGCGSWLCSRPGRLWRTRRRVAAAARRHDARAAQRELLAWAALRWPAAPPATLGALAARLAQEKPTDGARPQALAAIESLSRQLYGRPEGLWNGEDLARAAVLARRKKLSNTTSRCIRINRLATHFPKPPVI